MSAEAIIATGKILGSLLYFSPSSEQGQPLIHWLQSSDWEQDWPYGEPENLQPIVALLASSQGYSESEDEAFQRLFVGPYALPAPPWGSVYLDRESVLFGDSTLALREWMRQNDIEPNLTQAEPEDHFGLMLMMAAWLADHSPGLLDAFLVIHLFPWSSRYLALLEQRAVHPFYQAIAQLAQHTLTGWQEQCSLPIIERELYH
ncbi:Tat proofreading chaperone DmsD [Ewingella sp. S1.OA.A_B6]